MLIQTDVGELDTDREYATITLGRRDVDRLGLPADRDVFTDRIIENARVRAFDQDGEARFEVTGTLVVPTREVPDGPLLEVRAEATVGFFTEDVVAFEE